MIGEKHPTNIPGTSDTYPNWKPKLLVSVEVLATVSLVEEIAEVCKKSAKH